MAEFFLVGGAVPLWGGELGRRLTQFGEGRGLPPRQVLQTVAHKWSKMVQDKWPKGRVALVTKNKTRFGTLGRNPWRDFPHFSCVSAYHGPSLIFQISST